MLECTSAVPVRGESLVQQGEDQLRDLTCLEACQCLLYRCLCKPPQFHLLRPACQDVG